MSDKYGAANVHGYTFAAPSPFGEEVKNNYTNIHNFLCWDDNVPTRFGTQYPWYGYGYYIWFYQDESSETEAGYQKLTGKRWQETYENNKSAISGLRLGLGLHAPSIYLAFLQSNPHFEPRKGVFHVYYMRAKCPVNIEVFNSADELVGRIVNDEVDGESKASGVVLTVKDGLKSVYFAKGDTYTIRVTGTGEGTMTFTAGSADLNAGVVEEEKIFSNVQIADQKKMVSRLALHDGTDTDESMKISEVELLVTDESGGQVAKVLSDQEAASQGKDKGTEVPVSGQTDGGLDGILPGDIPSDGKIPEGLWIAAIADITYTGGAVTPDVHVYDGNVRLKENIDYKVSYKNNKNAAKATDTKAPTVTVTGRGNYSGKETAAFTILPVDIGGSEVFAANFQVKTGTKAVKPVPELYYLGTKLSNKRDFTVAYANASGVYAQAGEYDVTVTGKGNYTGTRTLKLNAVETVVKAKPVSLAKATLGGFQQAFAYTGQVCRQQCTLTVKMPDGKNRTLAEGTDYTVLYANDKKAGKATVTYCGKNGFTGKLKKTYKIQPYNIQENAGGKIQYAVKDCVYAKGGSKPKPDIRFDGAPMKEGTDYTLSYQNNKAAGGSKTPTVTVTGKGSFTGKIQIPFAITPQDLSNMTLVSGDRVYKNKTNIYRITPKLMDLDGKLLTAGKDFDKNSITYAYENDVSLENGVSKRAGDAVEKTDIIPADTRIRVTLAKGNGSDYTGTYVGSYRITKADIGSARVTVSKQSYTGQEVRSDQSQITVKLGGKTLSPEDYRIVRYSNNVDKGKASVVIAGKGNYGGVKTVNFTIRAKGFLWWWRPAASTSR